MRQVLRRTASPSREKILAAPSREHTHVGRAHSMRASILARIFHRVQVNKSELLVLDAILSKANMFGKHAKVAHEVIQAITGLARSTVYAAIARLESLFEKYQ